MAESGTLISEDAGAAAGACKPRLDMCNEKASMNAFTYCVWNAPFSGSACRGGCCFSSGKCASSSCAISGMGRDVANMICYGANNGVGFGGNSNCAGLACKLATPGCTTDAFGGNCVGTVVPFGSKDAISAESLKLIGAPCLDATPSDTTLDAAGAPASGEEGIYMGKLWTICDCTEGGTGLMEPAARLLNLTTTRISNFTKNEVLAAFSTLLPQKNLTDEAAPEGKSKVVTLLPSFADMFKLPALSGISLPNLIGSLSGPKGAAKNSSLPLPKLPDLAGLLTQIKPPQAAEEPSAATQPALNFESGSLPNGTEAAADMVETPGFAPEKPVRTLGSLFSRFSKPKDQSNSDGSSTFTPGSTAADQSASTKVKPMTLGALLGGLRRAGPDNSTTAPTPASATAGNSTKKLDLSPIGALITKFINGPPPPAQPAAATTTATPAVSANAAAASPAANGSVPAATQASAAPTPGQPAPAAASPVSSQPANTGPAALDGGPKGKVVLTPAAATPATPEPATPAASPEPGAAMADPNYIPGDPKNRPPTLAERIRAKKLADKAAKAAGNSTESPSTPPPPVEAPAPVRKPMSGFSANVDLPHLPREWEQPATIGGVDLGALLNTIGYLTQLLSHRGAGANPDDIAQVTALLTQLQQLPGGLASLPPDVSQALMVLAAEMSRVTAEQSAAQTPAEAPSTAEAPAAAPTTADSEKRSAEPTEPSAQPVTTAVASQPATAEPAAVASAAQPVTAATAAQPAAAETTAAVPAAAATTAAKPAVAASAANSPAQPAATATTAPVPAAVATAKPTAAADTTAAKPAAAATVPTAAKPTAIVAKGHGLRRATAAAKPAAATTVATAAQPAAAAAAAAKPKAAEATTQEPAAAAVSTAAKPAATTATQPAAAVATAAHPAAATAAKPTTANAAQPSVTKPTGSSQPTAAAAAAAAPAVLDKNVQDQWHVEPSAVPSSSRGSTSTSSRVH